jgi:hypothetical protein
LFVFFFLISITDMAPKKSSAGGKKRKTAASTP